MKKKYNLSPDTIVRVIEILQTAIITGTDIGVLFSEIEVEQSKHDKTMLDLTNEYKEKVKKWNEELEKANTESQTVNNFIVGNSGGNTGGFIV